MTFWDYQAWPFAAPCSKITLLLQQSREQDTGADGSHWKRAHGQWREQPPRNSFDKHVPRTNAAEVWGKPLANQMKLTQYTHKKKEHAQIIYTYTYPPDTMHRNKDYPGKVWKNVEKTQPIKHKVAKGCRRGVSVSSALLRCCHDSAHVALLIW